jgi:hypothetical protein
MFPTQRAVALVSSGDLVDLRRALDAYPGIVVLTPGWDGVQVRGCGDRVIAHVAVNPLAGAQLAQHSLAKVSDLMR